MWNVKIVLDVISVVKIILDKLFQSCKAQSIIDNLVFTIQELSKS